MCVWGSRLVTLPDLSHYGVVVTRVSNQRIIARGDCPYSVPTELLSFPLFFPTKVPVFSLSCSSRTLWNDTALHVFIRFFFYTDVVFFFGFSVNLLRVTSLDFFFFYTLILITTHHNDYNTIMSL